MGMQHPQSLCFVSLSLSQDQLCSSNSFRHYTNTTEHIYPDPFGEALLHVASKSVVMCYTQPLLIHAYAFAAVMPVICVCYSCHDACVCAFVVCASIAMMHVL